MNANGKWRNPQLRTLGQGMEKKKTNNCDKKKFPRRMPTNAKKKN